MINFSLKKNLYTAQGEMQLAVNCSISQGEFISLYGKSGAGKTSLLRMLAGLMHPDDGYIHVDKEVWFNHQKKIYLSPQKRSTGFVFQDYALFPNMNVRQNIAYALPARASQAIVNELLELTELTGFINRKIQTLSGGQQQRVALARAIAKRPALLLLDEPLSAIDNELRLQLQDMLLRLHTVYKLTTILVSHDTSEIVKLSDRIIRLDNGVVNYYATSTAFLESIGQVTGITGTIVAVNDHQLSVFVQYAMITIPLLQQETGLYKKGTSVSITYEKDGMPAIKKVP